MANYYSEKLGEGNQLKELIREWQQCVTGHDAGERLAAAKVNRDTRLCRWEGQDWSGRKWDKNYKREVFPWNGASDMRVPLIDLYVMEDMAMLMMALFGGKFVFAGTESSDASKSKRVTDVMRWMVFNQMEEFWDQAAKNVLAQLLNGIDVDVKPQGQNYKLRLQILNQSVVNNPVAMKKLNEDPYVQQLVMKRVKQLQFQITQHEVNPLLGRVGREAAGMLHSRFQSRRAA